MAPALTQTIHSVRKVTTPLLAQNPVWWRGLCRQHCAKPWPHSRSFLGLTVVLASEAGWVPEEGSLPADLGPSVQSPLCCVSCSLAWPYRCFLQGNQNDFQQAFLCPFVTLPREDRFRTSSGVVIKPLEITVARCLHGSAPCTSAAELGAFHRAFPAGVQGDLALHSHAAALCLCHCWRLAHGLPAEYCHWPCLSPSRSQTYHLSVAHGDAEEMFMKLFFFKKSCFSGDYFRLFSTNWFLGFI